MKEVLEHYGLAIVIAIIGAMIEGYMSLAFLLLS